jgi:hypothetical protein
MSNLDAVRRSCCLCNDGAEAKEEPTGEELTQ